MRQADQRDVGPERVEEGVLGHPLAQVGVQHPQFAAALRGDALQHVAVGREVVIIGHQDVAARLCVERRVD